jgi:hypothetical protein
MGLAEVAHEQHVRIDASSSPIGVVAQAAATTAGRGVAQVSMGPRALRTLFVT